MATTYTTQVRLQKPATADRQWDIPLNANADYLDSLAPIGGMALTTQEFPSISLCCRVSAGTYLKSDGSPGSFAGVASLALPPGVTSFLWLTDAGVLSNGTAFPMTPHLRLAQVQTGTSTILSISDARMAYQSVGANGVFVPVTGGTIRGPLQVASPTSGTSVLALDPTNQLIGFFGTPAAAQATKLNLLTDSTGGTASDILNNVGTSFSQTIMNNNFASMAAKIDSLISALKRHGLMSS